MGKHLPLLIMGVLAVVYFVGSAGGSLIKPAGPDMVAAFSKDANKSGLEARKDAAQFAALCRSLHNALKSDWEQESYIDSGAKVDNLRIIARKIRTGNHSYSEHYPNLKNVLEAHFKEFVGLSGGPLDEKAKEGWLKAYESLAECTEYAASNL